MPPTRQQAQRSNIRTRSQQQPIVTADLTLSPLKVIRRQNQIATAVQTAHTATITEPQPEQQEPAVYVPVGHGKRSSPSSFASPAHDWKRQRVSVERDEEKSEPTSSRITSTDSTDSLDTLPSPHRPIMNEPVHLNLAKISQSPLKLLASPTKLFRITTRTGGTIEMPVTPRRFTLNPENITETNKVHFTPATTTDAQTSTSQPLHHTSTLEITRDTAQSPPPSGPKPADLHTKNETSDAIAPAVLPPRTPEISAPPSPRKSEPAVRFETPVRPRETITPGPSRLPKPSSSFRISSLPDHMAKTPVRVSNPLAATISSLAKAKPRISPMRLRSRPQLKTKLGIKDRAPPSKLALKRTIRRTSLNKEKIKEASSSSLKPTGASAGAAENSTKGTKQTTLTGFFQPRSLNSGRISSAISSPSKPTPLMALSTALKKLEVSAPLPPARPAAGNGPPGSADVPKNAVDEEQVDASDASKRNLAATEGSRTTPKAQLPMRLPTNPDINGRTVGVLNQSPTNRNSVTGSSSTVASEPKEQRPPEESASKLPETLDVEAWSDEVAEGQKENKRPLEFFIPLADEPTNKPHFLAQISPSRRASQASLALSQSLSDPNNPQIFPQARSVSASHLQLNARSPVKTRGKTKPTAPAPEPVNQTTGKRLNARMPGSLDVLKDCVIYVDVRTEEGEDAAPLFVDMLRGLGARILSKPGKSCTHLVFKAGLPSTVVKYKLLPQPKPLVVSIGWVVECVEKRSHVEESKFLVNLDDFDVTGGSLRRRSMTMQPKQIRALILGQLDPSDSGDSSMNGGDASFTTEGSSTAGNLSPPGRATIMDNLPPLERARQRSRRLPRKK